MPRYIEVQAPPGETIAYIYQDWSVFLPSYTIYDRRCNPILAVQGPFCTQSCIYCWDVQFEVTAHRFLKVRTLAGVIIGMITKKWGGFSRELFTDADIFSVSFPLDLDVHYKAALLACTMLIDYMFFESSFVGRGDILPGML
ncbi:phospholipid scramblase 3-like [Ixodes scapularis]|uniref:phospholipid scramblase 3-like n=1 Tax=Ixodes scapularis TaxID=6945 RepID=UPI001C387880|nr:phospholipid scramblase 3-like [Ixodes scapularis]